MVKLSSFLAVLVYLLSGCVSNGGVSLGKTNFNEARTREIKQLEAYSFGPEDRFFSTTAMGVSAPRIASGDEFYHISIPINTQAPVECLVYKGDADAATTLKSNLAAMLSKLPEHQVFQIDAGTFKHLPYLYQETLYKSGNAVGTLKGVVVPVPSALVVCVHDEVGYVETFKRVVESLVTSFKIDGKDPVKSKYYEVLIWNLRDMNVGYTVNRFVSPSRGEIKNFVTTAMVIPRTTQETIAEDTYDIMVEDGAGRLLKGTYVGTENGEFKHAIRLERKKKGKYQISGQFQGKEIDSLLTSKTDLAGSYHQSRELVRVAKSNNKKHKTLRLDTYVPSASPLKSLLMTAKPTGKLVGKLPEYEMRFGNMKAKGIVDENGAKNMTISLGPVEMRVTRVYAAGQI